MSLVSLLFNTRAPQSAEIAGFTMDVTIREGHERTATITNFPIETGSRISDNRVTEPKTLVIEGFVSSAPVSVFPFTQQESLGFSRIKNAFDLLDEIFERDSVFQVITGYTVYENMHITNLSRPREGAEGLRFIADFQQIEIIDSEIIEFERPQPAPAVADQAAPTVSVGKQSTRNPSAQTEQRSSVLFNVTRGLF